MLQDGVERDEDAAFVGTPPPSPSIDPSQPPRWLGLSFVVGGDRPRFRVCATWARHLADGMGWRRTPDAVVTAWQDATTSQWTQRRDEIELRVETGPLRSGGRRLSVWLINVRRTAARIKKSESELMRAHIEAVYIHGDAVEDEIVKKRYSRGRK